MSQPVDVGLLDPLTGDVAQLVGDAAYLRAMVRVEAALSGALVDAGAAAPEAADGFDAVFDRLNLGAIAAAGASGGNAVIPVLHALRQALPDSAVPWLHFGATSQDVVDTAAMLVAADVVRVVVADLDRITASLSQLVDAQRHTPVAGRTLGQHAAPTTFGLRFSVLLTGVVHARARLLAVELPAQLGGSVGTLAVVVDAFGADRAQAARAAFAERLGLTNPPGVWHMDRGGIADLGAALAQTIGILGRLGLEVGHLASTEFGEVSIRQAAGDGGSSAMPQKRNPVDAVLLVGAARRAPGLVATLLDAQLALDDRPSGDWHAEWQPLRELLRLAAESAVAAARLTDALTPDAARMRANIDLSGGAIHAERAQRALAERFGAAGASALVTAALADGSDFVAALLDRIRVEHPADQDWAAARIGEVTALGGPIGLSDVFIDSALDAALAASRRPA